MRSIRLIAHNIRSAHNIGALLRTADGLGVEIVYFTGYSPYPELPRDQRLPHIYKKLSNQISKTALGAERSIRFEHHPDIAELLTELKSTGFTVAGLEQSPISKPLHSYQSDADIALLLGEEVSGISADLIEACDILLEIPMFGEKESFNVVEAASMALFQLRFH
jgi:23S rRNA (guanosine2251-2'-O)-methyltransferase